MLKVSLGADCSHAAQLPTPPQLGSHTPAPLAISSARCTSRLAVTSPDSIKSFIKSSMASRLRGSDFTPLICSGDPQLSGTPAWEGDGPCGTRPHQVHQKDGAPMRKRWDNWSYSAWKREGSRVIQLQLSCTWRELTGKVYVVTREGERVQIETQ